MHVSRSGRRQIFRGDSFSALVVIPVYVIKPKDTELHPQYRDGFLCKLCVQSPHQDKRAPYQDCRLLSPPYTNKQDLRPFMITHAHSAMSEFDKRGRG